MKIYSWNVNGIRAVLKRDKLQNFLKNHQPDILCLQETKAHESQVEINLPEYTKYWNSAKKKGYSGTAIFTKVEPISHIEGIPNEYTKKYQLVDKYGDTKDEGRVLTLEFDNFYLSTVYTPNSKDDLSRIPMRQNWDPAYLAYMKYLETKKPVIFCGDLNAAHQEIDLARPKENNGKKGFTKEERQGIDNIIEAGFCDSFRMFEKKSGHYTWWTYRGEARERNVGWRIDYFFVSQELVSLIKYSRIHPEVFCSDHCPVSIEISGLE